MIICGFAGIGKSQAARRYPNVVDLESTPFEKDWPRYVKVAKHMHDNGMIVLLSCHEELRAELRRQGIDYVCVVPRLYDWEVYYKRYKDRGNTTNFINMMYANWEIWLSEIHSSENHVYELPENAVLSQELYFIEDRIYGKPQDENILEAQLLRVKIPQFRGQFVIERQFDAREGSTTYLKYFRDTALTPINIIQEENNLKRFTIKNLCSSEIFSDCELVSYFSEGLGKWVDVQ